MLDLVNINGFCFHLSLITQTHPKKTKQLKAQNNFVMNKNMIEIFILFVDYKLVNEKVIC